MQPTIVLVGAVEIPGASHAVPVAHPDAMAHLILEAAALRVTA
jgi:hypothetical protein